MYENLVYYKGEKRRDYLISASGKLAIHMKRNQIRSLLYVILKKNSMTFQFLINLTRWILS